MIRSNKELLSLITCVGDYLSIDILHEAIKRYDDIKLELHAALKLSPDDIENIEDTADNDYMLKFLAMYMAAEKRDTDAFPLIVNYFTTHEDQAWNSLSEMSPVDLGSILASVCDADAELLKTTIIKSERGSIIRFACLDALGVLICEEAISRQTLVEWFRTWLRDDTLDLMECSYLADICLFVHLWELKDDVLDALKYGRIENNDDLDASVINGMLSPTSGISDENCQQFSRVNDAVTDIAKCSSRNYFSTLSKMFNNDEFKALMPFFLNIGDAKEEGKFMPAFLHGFMFAIALTPADILPGEWHPHLFGDEVSPFTSDKTAEDAQHGLLLLYERLSSERLDNILTFPFYDDVEGINKNITFMAKQWCIGFCRATELLPDYWLPAKCSIKFTDAMATVTAFADEDKGNELLKSLGKRATHKERKWLLAECCLKLPYAIHTLIQSTQQIAASTYDSSPRIPAKSTKVGRNTPCPCGSGKKFKKCCGGSGQT